MTIKIIIYSIVLSIFGVALSFANPSGMIYASLDSGKKIINIGPCFLEEKIHTSFVLKNTGDAPLRMLAVAPGFLRYASPTAITPYEYTMFNWFSPQLPYNLLTANDTLVVEFDAGKESAANPIGRKETMLDLGLTLKTDTTVLVTSETFLLISKLTKKYFDGFEEEFRFDSTYIGSSLTNTHLWKARNVSKKDIRLDSQILVQLSQGKSGKEIFVEEKTYPINTIPKNDDLGWKVDYIPKDIGSDTSRFTVYYKPNPVTYPDSIDNASVKIIGVGVKQNIEIKESNYDFSGDTIKLGDLRVGEAFKLKASLTNSGNCPFGVINQNVYLEDRDLPFPGFTFKKELLSEKGNITSKISSDFEIDITPNSIGHFVARYVLVSDITNRNIFGVPNSAKRKTIYISGRGVAPIIGFTADTINFGNVVYSGDLGGDCSSQRDSVVKIYNRGNAPIKISAIKFFESTKFEVYRTDLYIPANSDSSITISFKSSYPDEEHIAKLAFINDSKFPADTAYLILKAFSVPPSLAYFSVAKNMRMKPGNVYRIPLILNHESYKPAILVKQFSCRLSYNPTILSYSNKFTINCAAEGAISVIDDSDPRSIKIDLRKNNYFLPKDTLILIEFNAYLGDNVSTEIAIDDIIFSDGKCDKVLDVKPANGSVILDSICGLDYKINKSPAGKNLIKEIYPNPVSDKFVVKFETAFNTKVVISVYNEYGELIYTPVNGEMPAGDYDVNFNSSELRTGIYFMKMTAGLYSETKSFTVTR